MLEPKYSNSHPSHCLLMGSQQGVAESEGHLPWAPAICNDQSSDPSARNPLVSLYSALLFWPCSSTLGKPCRLLHRRMVAVGTVQWGDMSMWRGRLQDILICEKRYTSSPVLTDHSMVNNFLLHAVNSKCASPNSFCQHSSQTLPCSSLSDIQPLTFWFSLVWKTNQMLNATPSCV